MTVTHTSTDRLSRTRWLPKWLKRKLGLLYCGNGHKVTQKGGCQICRNHYVTQYPEQKPGSLAPLKYGRRRGDK